MPILSAESPDLRAEGPLVTITLGLIKSAQKALLDAGQPVPAPIQATAMIDTGASMTIMRIGLIESLGLQPSGVMNAQGVAGSAVCRTFALQLGLPNQVATEIPKVGEVPLSGTLDALIGRDVLAHGVFIYQGRSSQFTLAF